MPETEFIHTKADIGSALRFSVDQGLRIIIDAPQDVPRPCFLRESDIEFVESGVFHLVSPDWIHGPLQMSAIDEGYNKGRFFLRSNTNFSCITVYFQGEGNGEDGCRMLGGGQVFYKTDWISFPSGRLRTASNSLPLMYRKFLKHACSGMSLHAAGHRYHLCHDALNVLRSTGARPPFPFIVWPSELVRKREG